MSVTVGAWQQAASTGSGTGAESWHLDPQTLERTSWKLCGSEIINGWLFPCEVLIYTSLRQLSVATPQSRQAASWCRWVRTLAQRSYTISTSFQTVPLLWVKVWELSQEDRSLPSWMPSCLWCGVSAWLLCLASPVTYWRHLSHLCVRFSDFRYLPWLLFQSLWLFFSQLFSVGKRAWLQV